jgi:ATP-binding cassette subfamily C protein
LNSLSAIRRLLVDVPPIKIAGLLVLMISSGLSDGISILLLVPLLSLLQGAGQSNGDTLHLIRETLGYLHIPIATGSLLSLFVVIIGLRSILVFIRDKAATNTQLALIDRLRTRCFTALMFSEWRWLSARRQSDHSNLILTNVTRVGNGLSLGVSFISTLATIVAYLLVAFSLSFYMTSLALASGAAGLVLVAKQRHKSFGLGESLSKASRELHAKTHESLAGAKLAKILGAEHRLVSDFSRTVYTLQKQQTEFSRSASAARGFLQVGGTALLAVYLFLGLTLWHLATPTLLTLVFVFSRLIPLFTELQQLYQQWLQALPAAWDTYRLLDEATQNAEPSMPAATAPLTIQTDIRLAHVAVRYPERGLPALGDISLTFPVHTTTAIMGASGAGKSTLADLLMGLITPDSGHVLIDGDILVGALRQRWRHSVAYVPQEVFLFNDTIRNNLLWGQPDASDEALNAVLTRAAATFVFKMPLGLDTVVGDAGVLLSGGERQRLALARALLKKPALLILDEATSALDVDNEARIREAIEHLHGDLTVVIIGHRLPTLEHADQVVILDGGRIIAQGSWDDVKAQQGRIP